MKSEGLNCSGPDIQLRLSVIAVPEIPVAEQRENKG
jgi:hypothetical protein